MAFLVEFDPEKGAAVVFGIFLAYLFLVFALGALARSRAQPGHEDFFLARRRLGGLVLLLTLAATNFSSFTIFGFAGAGYRFGYSYYPIMAFGTGFMALTFLLIGVPAYRAGKQSGAVTPPELIYLRFRNRGLHLAYLLVMVVFTLPYLALQPMGAGYLLAGLFGVPYQMGAAVVVVVGLFYVLLAGLRGDVWTDLLQGVVMLAGVVLVFFAVVRALGGFVSVSNRLAQGMPELFSRPGRTGFFTPGIWFSYLVLWFVCDPMFPQLFQRFLAARSVRSLQVSALGYPVVTGVLFFFPVALGVLGHTVLPGLEGSRTDQVLPLLVGRTVAPFFHGVLAVCGIAALMSTMDSQLLTLSSILVRDTRILLGRPAETARPIERPVIFVLAGLGLLLALKPWGTILEIATETFTGLAVLFPITIAACYWGRASPGAGLLSIIVGELMVVLYHLKLLPAFGLLPVIPVILLTGAILVFGSLLFPAHGLAPWSKVNPAAGKWIGLFALVFLLSLDFYNWGRWRPLMLGLPFWMWFHIGLNAVLFFALIFYYLGSQRRAGAGLIQRGAGVQGAAEAVFDKHYAPGEGDQTHQG